MQRSAVEIEVRLDGFDARFRGMAPALAEPLIRAGLSTLQIGMIFVMAAGLGLPLLPFVIFVVVLGLGLGAGIYTEMTAGTPCWTVLSATQHRLQLQGERTPTQAVPLEALSDVVVSANRLILCTDTGTLTVPTDGNTLESVQQVAAGLRRLIDVQQIEGPRAARARGELLEQLRRLAGAAQVRTD